MTTLSKGAIKKMEKEMLNWLNGQGFLDLKPKKYLESLIEYYPDEVTVSTHKWKCQLGDAVKFDVVYHKKTRTVSIVSHKEFSSNLEFLEIARGDREGKYIMHDPESGFDLAYGGVCHCNISGEDIHGKAESFDKYMLSLDQNKFFIKAIEDILSDDIEAKILACGLNDVFEEHYRQSDFDKEVSLDEFYGEIPASMDVYSEDREIDRCEFFDNIRDGFILFSRLAKAKSELKKMIG